MTTENNVTDVVANNEETTVPTQQPARLASAVTPEGKFCVGVCLETEPQADSQVTLTHPIVYSDINAAIAELEGLVANARSVRDNMIAKTAYTQALSDLQAKAADLFQQVSSPAPAPAQTPKEA